MTDNCEHDYSEVLDCVWCDAKAVIVPAKGEFLVVDGVVTQVHKVRKEADFMLNKCEPGDICGAEDGCNV